MTDCSPSWGRTSAGGATRDGAQTLPVVTAMDDDAWWSGVGAVLESVWDPDRFPTLTSPDMAEAWQQVGSESGYFLAEALSSFEFGLARVPDSVEAFVERRES